MIMLSKIISYIEGSHEQVLQECLVRLSLGQQMHEFVSIIPCRGVFVGHTAEVFLRDRVDDRLPLLDPLLTVQFQDGVVGFTIPYSSEAVEETATIDETSRDSESSPRVAEVGGVGGEENATDSEFCGTSLMHFVGCEVDQLVLVWLRVTWEHGLELPWLSLLVLFNGQSRCFAISDAIKSIPCYFGCHLHVLISILDGLRLGEM